MSGQGIWNATVEIQNRNALDFRTISKLAREALGFLRHLKASQFGRDILGSLSTGPQLQEISTGGLHV